MKTFKSFDPLYQEAYATHFSKYIFCETNQHRELRVNESMSFASILGKFVSRSLSKLNVQQLQKYKIVNKKQKQNIHRACAGKVESSHGPEVHWRTF